MPNCKIIVNIAVSADGYGARTDGSPLIAPRHCEVPLRLQSLQEFSNGVVQLHYKVQRAASSP
ncbi:MAG TPA: hypothetical protein VFB28_13640 [Terriglobales bacterium]|nr:hypothetical protein [Terriglobales bacterium]